MYYHIPVKIWLNVSIIDKQTGMMTATLSPDFWHANNRKLNRL